MPLGTMAARWAGALGAHGQDKPSSWRKATGPIGTAALELGRIGWTWESPFTFKDPAGAEIELTTTAWRDVKKALIRGVAARMCKEQADKEWPGSGLALELDPLRRWAERKGCDPLARGVARTLAAKGIWTRVRLAEAGYILDVSCPECGQRDDLFHRLWACEGEDVRQAREKVLAKAAGGLANRAAAASASSSSG